MKSKGLILLVSVIGSLFALAPQPSETIQALATPRVVHRDGTIASMTPLEVKGISPGVKMYRVFYWSHNVKVEALLSKPIRRGKYPVLVLLHGGMATPNSITHYNFGESPAELAGYSDKQVVLAPEYRGYMSSGGSIQGVLGTTSDVDNALLAINSLGLSTNHLYLQGYSLGGCIALMLASERHNVSAVVAVSPFVGFSVYRQWVKSQNRSLMSDLQLSQFYFAYGDSAKAYRQHSPDLGTISAPVLLLQGTGDVVVPWQSVRLLYEDMRKLQKNVVFKLYPGGQHGLHDKYARASYDAITTWLTKYGLPK